MKSVTCFINSLAGGGAEHQMVILANLLKEKGYDVSYITYNDSDDGVYKLREDIKHIRIACEGNRIKKLWKLNKFMLKYKTDCIISYRQPVNLILLTSMIFRKYVKVIVGERSFTVGKPSLAERLNFNIFYNRADYIVPNSYTQTNYIVSKKPKFRNKTITICNYTEIDKYKPSPMPNGDVLKIGIFGRYSTHKNYENLVEAVKLLVNAEVKNFEISWYGKSTLANGEFCSDYVRFRNLVDDFGLSQFIKLNGLAKDVATMMDLFDVICLPSIFEGFSNSLSEAISCAKPILASKISDNVVMVKENINGFLFNPNDPTDIANAFHKMIDTSYEKRVDMASNSRKIAEDLFDKEHFVNSYIKLIES